MNKRKNPEEKEIREKMINSTNQELRDCFADSQAVLDNQKGKITYSQIFHKFMEPIINEVLDDEKLLINTLNWGQLVWNKAVAEDFPNLTRSKDLEKIFPLFKATFHDKALIAEFLERKKVMFKKENFFIVKQTSLLDTSGRLCISVAALQIED